MRKAFPEACVEGYEPLIESMTNHPKDRHILAAAVRSKSELIVTYNKRDFSNESTAPWTIAVRGPSTFVNDLYDLDSGVVIPKLNDQASNLGMTMEKLLLKLRINVPGFVDSFASNWPRSANARLSHTEIGARTEDERASRVSAKPAMQGHFKTGHSRPGTLDVVPTTALSCKSHF